MPPVNISFAITKFRTYLPIRLTKYWNVYILNLFQNLSIYLQMMLITCLIIKYKMKLFTMEGLYDQSSIVDPIDSQLNPIPH